MWSLTCIMCVSEKPLSLGGEARWRAHQRMSLKRAALLENLQFWCHLKSAGTKSDFYLWP